MKILVIIFQVFLCGLVFKASGEFTKGTFGVNRSVDTSILNGVWKSDCHVSRDRSYSTQRVFVPRNQVMIYSWSSYHKPGCFIGDRDQNGWSYWNINLRKSDRFPDKDNVYEIKGLIQKGVHCDRLFEIIELHKDRFFIASEAREPRGIMLRGCWVNPDDPEGRPLEFNEDSYSQPYIFRHPLEETLASLVTFLHLIDERIMITSMGRFVFYR